MSRLAMWSRYVKADGSDDSLLAVPKDGRKMVFKSDCSVAVDMTDVRDEGVKDKRIR